MKTIKAIFQSLISNAPIMEARKEPWYVALILFFVSILLATYPTFNQINNREGSAFLSGNTFSIENALVSFSETLKEEGVNLVVTEMPGDTESTFALINTGTTWATAFTDILTNEPQFPYFQYSVNNQPRLRVFYQSTQSEEVTNAFLNRLLALPTGSNQIASFMMLGNTAVYMYIYNPTALTQASVNGEGYLSAFTGTYHNVTLGTNLANFATLDMNGIAIPTTNVNQYISTVFANWLRFYDQSFAYTKSVLLLAQSGLTIAVNGIMALLMSLVIFIMTRGKNNPNKHFRFGETMKIGAWSLLSPALLTVVAGALFPEFAGTAFVLFVGLRLMWLSSRYLRPVDMTTVPVKK